MQKGEGDRIILTRPLVEAGERVGFLPGDLMAKVDPYFRPLYDALFDMLDPEKAERLLDRGQIEVAPLAFMRGRTLNNSFIILDEAQNTTPEQMKMFLTRIGFGSRVIITGDASQVDVPGGRSGIEGLEDTFSGIDGLGFVKLGARDVVRHKIVQDIVKAYENAGRQSKKILAVSNLPEKASKSDDQICIDVIDKRLDKNIKMHTKSLGKFAEKIVRHSLLNKRPS